MLWLWTFYVLAALIVLSHSDQSPECLTPLQLNLFFDHSTYVHMAFWCSHLLLSLIFLPPLYTPLFPTNWPHSWHLLFVDNPLSLVRAIFVTMGLELSYPLDPSQLIVCTPKNNNSLFHNLSLASSSAVRGKAPRAFPYSWMALDRVCLVYAWCKKPQLLWVHEYRGYVCHI